MSEKTPLLLIGRLFGIDVRLHYLWVFGLAFVLLFGPSYVWQLAPLFLIFIPGFWALFDQTGSAWVLQAMQMDRVIFGVELLPSQIQAANPFLILILIPVFLAGLDALQLQVTLSLLFCRRRHVGCQVRIAEVNAEVEESGKDVNAEREGKEALINGDMSSDSFKLLTVWFAI